MSRFVVRCRWPDRGCGRVEALRTSTDDATQQSRATTRVETRWSEVRGGRLGRPAALGRGPREKPAGSVAPLDRLRELRGDLRELGVGTPDRAHAPPFAHPVKLGDRLVEPLPEILGSAASGPGLQLVRRLGAAAGCGPFEPVSVRGLARRRPVGRRGSEPVQPAR